MNRNDVEVNDRAQGPRTTTDRIGNTRSDENQHQRKTKRNVTLSTFWDGERKTDWKEKEVRDFSFWKKKKKERRRKALQTLSEEDLSPVASELVRNYRCHTVVSCYREIELHFNFFVHPSQLSKLELSGAEYSETSEIFLGTKLLLQTAAACPSFTSSGYKYNLSCLERSRCLRRKRVRRES